MKVVDLDYIEDVNEIEELLSKDNDESCSELNKFVYYKLANVIKYCFNKLSLYQKITYHTSQNEPLQIKVPGL